MTRKDLISIIIPVCQAEAYLEECLHHILMQTFQNWELILVENGSTDNSLQICREYEERDDRIHVFQEERRGAAFARNRGLKEAGGTYVFFVDADDYLADADVIEAFYRKAEESKASVIVGNYERLWDGRRLTATTHKSLQEIDREEAAFRFRGFFSIGILSYLWGKMYRRDFLEKNQINFDALTYAEDKLFNFRCYCKGASYAFLDKCVYVYRRNDKSVSYQYREHAREDWTTIVLETEREIRENKLPEEYLDLAGFTVFFATFFDAKMEYVKTGGSKKAMAQCIYAYASAEETGKYFILFSKRSAWKKGCSLLWRSGIYGFSVAMRWKLYHLLACVLALFIRWRVDERLSDTGKRKK